MKKIFLKILERGLEHSEKDKLVTFGIVPTSAEIGYGYIKAAHSLDSINNNGSEVDKFIEKPDKDTAEIFIRDDRFTWNSGIFMFKATSILQEVKEFSPRIIDICNSSLKEKLYDMDFQRLDKESFDKCPNISIDVAVMEKNEKCLRSANGCWLE